MNGFGPKGTGVSFQNRIMSLSLLSTFCTRFYEASFKI